MVRAIVLFLFIIGISVLIGSFIMSKNQDTQKPQPSLPVIPSISPTPVLLDYPNEEFIPPFTTP